MCQTHPNPTAFTFVQLFIQTIGMSVGFIIFQFQSCHHLRPGMPQPLPVWIFVAIDQKMIISSIPEDIPGNVEKKYKGPNSPCILSVKEQKVPKCLSGSLQSPAGFATLRFQGGYVNISFLQWVSLKIMEENPQNHRKSKNLFKSPKLHQDSKMHRFQ